MGCCKVTAYMGALVVAVVAVAVAVAPRPLLALQHLVFPLQALLVDRINPASQKGYVEVAVPDAIRDTLAEFALQNRTGRRHEFSGEDGHAEDFIIFGRTTFLPLPGATRVAVRDAMQPLVEAFCDCALDKERALVHGMRVYRRGATLVPHLDWPHEWVVSATIHVRTENARGHYLSVRSLLHYDFPPTLCDRCAHGSFLLCDRTVFPLLSFPYDDRPRRRGRSRSTGAGSTRPAAPPCRTGKGAPCSTKGRACPSAHEHIRTPCCVRAAWSAGLLI